MVEYGKDECLKDSTELSIIEKLEEESLQEDMFCKTFFAFFYTFFIIFSIIALNQYLLQIQTTGKTIKGDPTTAVSLELLAKAVGIERVRVVDPYNLKECEDVIREEVAADEPSVVISRRPCALLKYVKHNPPLKINKDKCVGCKMCMKIGCPAISMRDGKSEIDFTQCVGFNVCSQLCKFDAIEEGK